MKKITSILLVIILTGTSAMAEVEKKVSSKINNVTVFLQGAQVQRKGKFKIDKGITKIIFEGMTQQFDKNSIQVKGKGSFIILDVSSTVFYPVPKSYVPNTIPVKIKKEITRLEDSISDLNWLAQELRIEVDGYKSEKTMLLTSGVIKGQNVNDSIAALIDAMDYMRVKLLELNKLIFKIEKKLNTDKVLLTKMNARLNDLKNYNYNAGNVVKRQLPVQQIIVTVSSDIEAYGTLEFSYMVPSAGWSPSYDLRADDVDSPVKLTYKANVYQNTGFDWKDVHMTLSTINPNRSNVKPTLATWYLRYYQPILQSQGYYNKDSKNKMAKESALAPATLSISENNLSTGADFQWDDLEVAEHMSNYTEMNNNMAMVEFELKIPQSIQSDGQTHLMAVTSEEIDASFQYHIVPKLDKDAFLMAKLSGWEDLNLLPAVANIYYDGTYVGQTRLNPSVMSDTLELALGRDRGIYLTRKKTSDEEKIKKLTGQKEKTVTYQLALKNYKSTNVSIIVEDQTPVSTIEDIKVELLEKGIADYNKKTGKLVWNINLDAKETLKYEFTYLLRYDKDKTLAFN